MWPGFGFWRRLSAKHLQASAEKSGVFQTGLLQRSVGTPLPECERGVRRMHRSVPSRWPR